jgi:hypothetical protein
MGSILQTGDNFNFIINIRVLEIFLTDVVHIVYSMKYVFIDESGDLGSKHSSSKYFVFAGIMVDNPKKLDNLIKNTYRKHKNIREMNEVKGVHAPDEVILDILNRLNNMDYQAFITVFDKRNMYKINYDYNVNKLYDILASQLAKIIPINQKTIIFLDKAKNKNQIFDFNVLYDCKLDNVKKYPVEINHVNSVNYKGLQVADLISWSTYQAFENEKNEFINIVENKSVKIICED